jgi:hypothetical protein
VQGALQQQQHAIGELRTSRKKVAFFSRWTMMLN